MSILAILTLALAFTPVAAETYRNLEIAPEEQSSTYERSKFRHWIDEDQTATASKSAASLEGERLYENPFFWSPFVLISAG